MLDANVYHPAMFFKLIMDKIKDKKRRFGIIITSSIASELPMPIMVTYAATKAFDMYLSRCVSYELKR